MGVVIEEPTLMDRFLECGLFVGAIFQLICILAVVILPASNSDQQSLEKSPIISEGNTAAVKSVSHDHSSKGVRKRNKKNR